MSSKRSTTSESSQGPSKSAKSEAQDHQSPIQIQALDLEGDYVTLINISNTQQNLAGWTLQSNVGKQRYKFPDGMSLPPGATISVWSGKKNTKKNIFWTPQYIWNNHGDTAQIKNPKDEVADEKEEKPDKKSAKSDLVIQGLDTKRECLTIINRGDKDLDITDYVLKNFSAQVHFKFPKGTLLKQGEGTTVWSGPLAEGKHHPPQVFCWTTSSLFNSTGDGVALYNNQGALLDKNFSCDEIFDESLSSSSASSSTRHGHSKAKYLVTVTANNHNFCVLVPSD